MKYLIFDCGGVLVWPRPGDWNIPYGAVEILGERAGDIFSSRYVQAHRDSARWLDESQLVPDVEAERKLRLEYIRSIDALMNWRLSPARQRRLADDFTDNPRRYGVFEDVDPWLKRWKGRYGLGMLSDAMPSILQFMARWGLLELFDAAVISTQVGATKPSPRMYAAILDALGADPADCLFVDDRTDNLEGALAAGMQAVQMARPSYLPIARWSGPVVHSFKELNGLIET